MKTKVESGTTIDLALRPDDMAEVMANIDMADEKSVAHWMTKAKEEYAQFRGHVTPETRKIDVEARTIPFVGSDESVDRYGDLIEVRGWDVKAYKKNPVFLWGHMAHTPPIGRSLSVKKELGDSPKLTFLVQFATIEESPFADYVFNLFVGKYLNMTSVGFLPTEIDRVDDPEEREKLGLGKWGVVFKKQELLELSAVSVPANPNAGVLSNDLADGFRRSMVDGVTTAKEIELMQRSLDAMNGGAEVDVVPMRGIIALWDELRDLGEVGEEEIEEPARDADTAGEGAEVDDADGGDADATDDEGAETDTDGDSDAGSESSDEKAGGTSHMVTCGQCEAGFDYGKQSEIAMGAIECPECEAVIDQEGNVLTSKDVLTVVQKNTLNTLSQVTEAMEALTVIVNKAAGLFDKLVEIGQRLDGHDGGPGDSSQDDGEERDTEGSGLYDAVLGQGQRTLDAMKKDNDESDEEEDES